MMRLLEGSAFVALATGALVATHFPSQSGRSVLLSCAGMELTQNAVPDDGSQDDNGSSDAQPGDGSDDGDSQSPDDGSDRDGTNSDQAAPDTAQPPGCIYENRPLELLV